LRRWDTEGRGDADGNGRINVNDAVLIIQIAVGNLGSRYNCPDALDANDDGRNNISDAVPVLRWVFQRGARLPAPFLGCGADPTDDELGCEESSAFCAVN
ncbi:MAG: dockerin type I domain-containing protein, partial [Planctomycetota bacterium]|nr:dockerin type I domain-containing protein [Planctomycetota bacterium]